MSVINGTSIPLSNLVLMADPRNTKCYSGAGAAATNQIDNLGLTVNSITYSGGVWFNNAAGVVQSNSAYSLSLSSGYTVIQWLNLTSRVGGTFSYTSGLNEINFYMGGANQMRWRTYGSGGDLNSNTTMPLSTWFMIAGSFSGTGSAGGSGTSRIYYNGLLDNYNTVSGTASNSANFQIGLHSGAMQGSIGPTMVYTRQLSDNEIRQTFNAFRTSFGL